MLYSVCALVMTIPSGTVSVPVPARKGIRTQGGLLICVDRYPTWLPRGSHDQGFDPRVWSDGSARRETVARSRLAAFSKAEGHHEDQPSIRRESLAQRAPHEHIWRDQWSLIGRSGSARIAALGQTCAVPDAMVRHRWAGSRRSANGTVHLRASMTEATESSARSARPVSPTPTRGRRSPPELGPAD